MPFLAPFTLDAATPATEADLTGFSDGDNLDVSVLVPGLLASDVVTQMTFTAKVNASDADSAPTSVQKTITPSQITESGIRTVSLAPTEVLGEWLLTTTDVTKLALCTVYAVRVWITRNSATYDRTVLRGVVRANAGTNLTPTTSYVDLTPNPATCPQFHTLQLTATVYDQNFSVLSRPVVWSSSNPAIATVDQNGLVTGVALGSCRIYALADGVLDIVALTVGYGVPTTPAQLLATVNAFGGGTIGGTMLAYYEKGTPRQHVKANGDPTLASPGTNSTTGYWCDFWDCENAPGTGLHFRPSAGINSGNGAPCTVDGIIQGIGLELPNATGLTGGAAFHADPGLKTDAPIPNSGNLRPIYGDYSAGITWGGCAKLVAGAQTLIVGEDAADPTMVQLYGDDFGNIVGLKNSIMWDDGAFHGASWFDRPTTGGTPVMHWSCGVNKCSEPEITAINGGLYQYMQFNQYGRDFLIPLLRSPVDVLAAGRRLRLGGGYGPTMIGAYRSQYAFYVMKGHCNHNQTKTICDYFDAKFAAYNDPRRLGYNFGDSEFTAKINLADQQAIQDGAEGAPAIFNFGYSPCAFFGMRPQLLIRGLLYYLQGLDFSFRPLAGVSVFISEWVNGAPGGDNETVNDRIAQNYYMADVVRAIDPTRMRIAMHNMSYVFVDQQAANDPAIKNDLAANAIAQGHADALIDYLQCVMWASTNAQFYGTGDPNRTNSIWDGIHPFHIGQLLWRARMRIAFRAAMGENVANVTNDIVSSIPVVNLSAGAPTSTPAWTVKNYLGISITKTLSFASWKHLAGQSHDDEVLDTSICTVHPTTGLITRVAAGVAIVVATSDDGGKGVCVVVCS